MDARLITIGSLFSGIGGLDMGVQSVLGGEVKWFSESMPYLNTVMKRNHPTATALGDITKINWSKVEPVDVLTGGFPCINVSRAGKRNGLIKGDEGTGLWHHMVDAIEQLQPSLVVAENVYGITSGRTELSEEKEIVGPRGGRKTQISDRSLGVVLSSLASIGYDARWYGLRASDVGATHGRPRVFIFATPSDADNTRWREFGRTGSI